MSADLYIDFHTHRRTASDSVFELLNVVVGRDAFETKYPFTAGIHPWYISKNLEPQFAELSSYAQLESALAIGECGLDKICKTEWTAQEVVFIRQLDLAYQLDKPLIIHCVRAYQEVMNILKYRKQTVIFHGFNKNPLLAKQILRQGHYLSLGADILRGHLDELIRTLPLDKIFLETDGKTVSIIDIYTYFCTARKINSGILRKQLIRNFEHVFKYSI